MKSLTLLFTNTFQDNLNDASPIVQEFVEQWFDKICDFHVYMSIESDVNGSDCSNHEKNEKDDSDTAQTITSREKRHY